MVSTTRPIICFTERSRSGEPMRPRKYFCATMFVAVCDQNFGNSTPGCWNTGLSLPGMYASRSSHSISSKGFLPSIVKKRRIPSRAASSTTTFAASLAASLSTVEMSSACAIRQPPEPIWAMNLAERPAIKAGRRRDHRTLGRLSDVALFGFVEPILAAGRRQAAGLDAPREEASARRCEQQERDAGQDQQRERDRVGVRRP